MIVNNANLITHWPSQPSIAVLWSRSRKRASSISDWWVSSSTSLRRRHGDCRRRGAARSSGNYSMAGSRLYTSLSPGLSVPWKDSPHIEAVLDEESLYWSALAGLHHLRSGATTGHRSGLEPVVIEGSLNAYRRFTETKVERCSCSPARDAPLLRPPYGRNARHHASCSERIQGLGLDASSGIEDETLHRSRKRRKMKARERTSSSRMAAMRPTS